MNSSTTSTPTARRLPVATLVVGALFWAVVAVAATIAFFRVRADRTTDVAPEDSAGPATLVVGKDGALTPLDKPRVLKPTDEPATPSGWDPHGVHEFSFTERNGKTVTKADLLGRPWIVGFIFTKCAGPCLTVSHSMSRLQLALKDTDVRLVTLTVDPDRDTTAVLQNYADDFGADSDRWLFLTGDKAKIHDLTLRSFLMPLQELQGAARKPGWEILHTTNLLLVDERGVVVAKYDGKEPTQVDALIDRLTGPAVAEIPRESAPTDSAAPRESTGPVGEANR